MSASPARLEANRVNAGKSTGPRTERGKQRSSLNALRHGLTSKMVILPDEDLETYQKFHDDFFADLKPTGEIEVELAFTLVNTQWRLNRCRAFEQTILTGEGSVRDHVESLSKLSLYEGRLTRIFQTTLKQFLTLQADRHQREELEMRDAVIVLRYCQTKQIPFQPSDFGFVFSTEQVQARLDRHIRLNAAHHPDMLNFNRHFFATGSR
jgi:hypothetical protein